MSWNQLSQIHSRPGRIDPGEQEDDRTRSMGDFLATIAAAEQPHSGPEARKRLERVYGSRLRLWGEIEHRALGISDGTAGGYLMPPALLNDVMAVVEQAAIVRPRAMVLPMEADELIVPAIDQEQAQQGTTPPYSGGFAMAWGDAYAQGHELPDEDFATRMLRLSARTLAGTITVPLAMFRFAPALSPALNRIFGEAVAFYEDRAFLTGNGQKEPLGIVNASGLLVSAARDGAGALTVADLRKIWARVLPVHRRNAVWLVSRRAEDALLGMTGASNSVFMPLLTPPMEVADTPALQELARERWDFFAVGRPGVVTEHLPPLNTPGDVLLADLARYVIGDNVTLEIAASEHVDFRRARVVFRCIHRVAGAPMNRQPLTPPDGGDVVSPFVALGTAG